MEFKVLKPFFWAFVIIFVLMNMVACFHAYKFTHFSENKTEKTQSPHKLSAWDKVKTIFFGVDNPRPANNKLPDCPFETIKLNSNKEIECWRIKADSAKGTIIIFHGYGGNKSSMLDKAGELLKLGYNTFLVDFMGSGSSEENRITIGYEEAEQVKTCYEYMVTQGESNIYLLGTSMGAVAILKALNDYPITPLGIIIECPFGSMYKTVAARFRNMGVPAFPMAGLLVFWGGVQNGFWAFGHNPAIYAKSVNCPALLMYGEQDKNVSRKEIDDIFANLAGRKRLVTYAQAGHENYLEKYKDQWVGDIKRFISE